MTSSPSAKKANQLADLIADIGLSGDTLKTVVDAMPDPGSAEYYNLMANGYATVPDQVARQKWMKELVAMHKDWIGVGSSQTNKNFKVLDYACGTGFLSQALAPYVTEILGVDSAETMTTVYNETAKKTKEANPECTMHAVWGDLIKIREPSAGMNPNILTELKGEFDDLDMVAMSLAIDFFSSATYELHHLKHALHTLTTRLKEGGTLLILDIERDYANDEKSETDPYLGRLRNARKRTGFGSKDVFTVLEELGLQGIEVLGDQTFRADMEFFRQILVREEVYFLLKATKGVAPVCGSKEQIRDTAKES